MLSVAGWGGLGWTWARVVPIALGGAVVVLGASVFSSPEVVPQRAVLPGDAPALIGESVVEPAAPVVLAKSHSPATVDDGSTGDRKKERSRGKSWEKYRRQLLAWFSAHLLVPPPGEVPCMRDRYLRVPLTVELGPKLRIVSVHEREPSGDPAFDHLVHEAAQRMIGRTIPPPPGSLSSRVFPTLDNAGVPCGDGGS